MGHAAAVLDDVRSQIAPDDVALKEARERRDRTTSAAEKFTGALRTFASGSLAHKTANCPIHRRDAGLDADCGVVLHRRYHYDLGPDSSYAVGPDEVLKQMKQHLLAELRQEYPHLKIAITKRALLMTFGAPLPGGEDPTVDLIVALDRAHAPGLWIPNTETHWWDPSHPEQHTALLTADPKALRLTRQHAIRLAKAENKRNATPPLCSFNLEAFGLMFVQPGMSDAEALLALWSRGAMDLTIRLTPDPAGVSAPIKVKDQPAAVRRLTYAGDCLSRALDHDGDADAVRRALHPLFPEFIPAVPGGTSTARIVASKRAGENRLRYDGAAGLGFTGAVAVNSNLRAYGDGGR